MFSGQILFGKKGEDYNILPIYYPSPITSYLHHTYFACICLGQENLDMFFSKYIQIYWNIDKFAFFPDLYELLYPPVMKIIPLNKSIINFSEENILDYIFYWIDSGHYIFMDIIEGIMEVTRFRGGDILIHPNLFFGYDKSKKILKLLNFDTNNNISVLDVPFSSFLKAFFSSKYKEAIESTPWVDDKTGIYPRLMLLDYLKDYHYAFSGKAMLEQLQDYLDSKNSLEKMYSIVNNSGRDYKWGIDVYKEIISYIKMLKPKEIIDIRILHGLWEHKKIMGARIKYLEDKKVINKDDNLLEKFSPIIEIANSARLLCMKYNFKFNDDYLKILRELVEEVMQKELPILERLVLQLDYFD